MTGFQKLKMPPPPTLASGPKKDHTEPIALRIRTELTDIGPYGPPRPGEKAPHKDVGELADDFVGDLQGIGEHLMRALDMPFEATIHIDGPHRLVDSSLDIPSGFIRGLVKTYTRFEEER